ncbi:DUF1573 domain-containing protein [Planctomicrobium piriforme]|uniref:DUF1573 domain-containing protein n=1 Tax=Planctomicrobium piriforme TaxID=1576369 RepID=A0A1I3DJG9_9PLAN|nr:DUF1573 domain-containing protein [Planctomicrobium piriforme]SFH86902.1 Protein of unknown function [Planctomicrobium piriforme]
MLAVIATLIACLAVFAWGVGQMPDVAKWTAQKPAATGDKPAEPATPVPPEHEHFPTNPFTPDKAATNQPKVQLPEAQYEFGRMALGKTGEHDFVVKNIGTAPLKLAKGPVQCKCTVSGLKEQEVPPGGEAMIHLAWTPKDIGPFAQVATIWTNDPEQDHFTVGASGTMYPEIQVKPDNGWALGPISNSNDVPLVGSLESPVIEKFSITKIEPSSDRVELEAVPYTAEELKEKDLLSGYHFLGRLKGIQNPSSIQESITVHTDLADHPKYEFPITGSRTGAVTIIGPTWFAGGPLIDLGTVSAEKGKEFKLTLMVNPGEEELKFTDVKINPGFVQMKLKPEQTGKELSRERYSLIITVPPGSPKGNWIASKPGQFLIKTNHAQIPELDIKLHLNVE